MSGPSTRFPPKLSVSSGQTNNQPCAGGPDRLPPDLHLRALSPRRRAEGRGVRRLSESNAVIFANSALGARTPNTPTSSTSASRSPDGRRSRGSISSQPQGAARHRRRARQRGRRFVLAARWLSRWRASPDRIPLLCGLADAEPSRNDLKALCVAFGTTSGAPMLHIVGVTPEAGNAAPPDANRATIARSDLASAWLSLNQGPETIDLVAIGSPHASPAKSGRSPARRPPGAGGRRGDRDRRPGRSCRCAEGRGAFAPRGRRRAGLPDLCWCSISEPVFPGRARTAMTKSGKYAHYGRSSPGRAVRKPRRPCRGSGHRQGRDDASRLARVTTPAFVAVVRAALLSKAQSAACGRNETERLHESLHGAPNGRQQASLRGPNVVQTDRKLAVRPWNVTKALK